MDSSEKTIAVVLGDSWWPQTANEYGDCRTSKTIFDVIYLVWKKIAERRKVGGVFY